jgi:hypothetical protein
VLWQACAWREELIQLLELLAERPLKQHQRRLHPLPWALPVPLRVHGHYTRAEIEAVYCFAAFGYVAHQAVGALFAAGDAVPVSTLDTVR